MKETLKAKLFIITTFIILLTTIYGVNRYIEYQTKHRNDAKELETLREYQWHWEQYIDIKSEQIPEPQNKTFRYYGKGVLFRSQNHPVLESIYTHMMKAQNTPFSYLGVVRR